MGMEKIASFSGSHPGVGHSAGQEEGVPQQWGPDTCQMDPDLVRPATADRHGDQAGILSSLQQGDPADRWKHSVNVG